MKPAKLVGMPYRLGADPEKNGAVDCLHLAKTVLANYGIKTPEQLDYVNQMRDLALLFIGKKDG